MRASIEQELLAAWVGRQATPFPGQIAVDDPEGALGAVRAEVMGRMSRVLRLFATSPCLGVWATLSRLAENYGASDNEVYRHISDALGLPLPPGGSRTEFKAAYRAAAARIGVALRDDRPTGLFFAPLGVADGQLAPLASTLVAALARFGPPATEDTPSAVAWQRRALRLGISSGILTGLARIRAAMEFDAVGHYALRANRWRVGEAAETDRDRKLFAALDAAARRSGITAASIVAPPALVWIRDQLALLAEPSSLAQDVWIGPFPDRLTPGAPLVLRAPWPSGVRWRAGREEIVPCAPAEGEVLLFDADAGALVARVPVAATPEKAPDEVIEIAARRVVALAARPFEAQGFGAAEPSRDPSHFFAWLDLDDVATLSFGAVRVRLAPSRQPALRIDAAPLGRAGARPLRAGRGAVEIQLSPSVRGVRLLRATVAGGARYAVAEPDADGRARIGFDALGLDAPGDPARVVLDLLPVGAAKGIEARSELRATMFVWPGVTRGASGEIEDAPRPTSFDAARSAGLAAARGRVWMDPAAEVETAKLAVRIDDGPVEFDLPFRGVRLWRRRVADGRRERVPTGARLILDHASRNDVFELEGPQCPADVRVLGRLLRRPLLGRRTITIGAGMLEDGADDADDRICLEHSDGSTETLARLLRSHDPASIVLEESGDAVEISFRPTTPVDAAGLRVRGADGSEVSGLVAIGRRQTQERPVPGVTVRLGEDGAVVIRMRRPHATAPVRADVIARRVDAEHEEIVRGGDGHPLCFGLDGPGEWSPVALGRLLAEPATRATGGQLAARLGPVLRAAVARVGERRMATPLLGLVDIRREDGGLPRADFLSGAPWIFEAAPSTFRGASWPIGRMADIPAPADPPDPSGNDPLGAWLDRLATDGNLPAMLGPKAFDAAFSALNARLGDRDLSDIRGEGALAGTMRRILETDSIHLDALRAHDRLGGHDPFGARLALAVERFARASATGRAEAHFAEIPRRTGLPPEEVGAALSLALRVAAEAFTLFRALWGHAARHHAAPSEQAGIQAGYAAG